MVIFSGSWHRLDVYWNSQSVRLVVDWCKEANVTDPEEGQLVSDLSSCEARGQTAGFQTGLNVHQPLQLGGLHQETGASTGFVRSSFVGCMKNLIVNGNMYDMNSAGHAVASHVGCDVSDEKCGMNDISGVRRKLFLPLYIMCI